MKPLAIMSVNLRRLVRLRTSVFFVVLAPLLLILLLGAAFGGQTTRIAVVAPRSELARQLVNTLADQPGVVVQRVSSMSGLRNSIQHESVEAGLIVPANYDRALRAGKQVQVRYYALAGVSGQQVSQIVQSGVANERRILLATDLLQREHNMRFDTALAHVHTVAPRVPLVAVPTVKPNGAPYPKPLGRFASGASTQLLLFVFLTSLTNSAALIETRRLGISRRMLASPTPVRDVIFGEALGRFAVAGVQAALIVVVSATLFSVNWGSAPAAAAITLMFCLVSAGFAMLLGSILATEQQALAAGMLIGLSLAALGGSMVPLQFFPSIMRDIAHVTPHAWGNEAFLKLLNHGTLANVLPQIGVLAAYAAAAFALATWRLRRVLTH